MNTYFLDLLETRYKRLFVTTTVTDEGMDLRNLNGSMYGCIEDKPFNLKIIRYLTFEHRIDYQKDGSKFLSLIWNNRDRISAFICQGVCVRFEDNHTNISCSFEPQDWNENLEKIDWLFPLKIRFKYNLVKRYLIHFLT
jgi:hypothetical protein